MVHILSVVLYSGERVEFVLGLIRGADRDIIDNRTVEKRKPRNKEENIEFGSRILRDIENH